MKLTWIKTEKRQLGEGIYNEGSVIVYEPARIHGITRKVTVESRKKKIRHAESRLGYGGKTYWEHTTYFVCEDGKDIRECYSRADAFEAAEEYLDGRREL